MYAVFQTGGKQYQVAPGDKLEIERIDAEVGSSHTFDHILLVNQNGSLHVGNPKVSSASVVADVVAHKRGPKVRAFKMKRRKGYHRTVGHRQELTVVEIKGIQA